MADKKLRYKRLLAFWKKALRLQDWDIVINEVPATEENAGECHTVIERKHAWIDISVPHEEDLEDTIVHELLHIHLAPFWPSDPAKEVMAEQAVDSIARTLVAIRRQHETGS